MIAKIFIVMGTTGEYSDRTEWPVCFYETEAKAQLHCELAKQEANKIEALKGNKYARHTGTNPYDPNMSMDYTGTSYYIWEVSSAQSLGDLKSV